MQYQCNNKNKVNGFHVSLILIFDEFTKISEVCRMMPISTLNLKYSNGCRFHIKFHKSSIYELNFYIRSMPNLAEVRDELNLERSFITAYFSKRGNIYL